MTIDHQFTVPERIWFTNTDMQSFYEFPRQPGDNSAFAHWLAADRLFVTPRASNPRKYHNALTAVMPGDPIFAYEDQVGFVALGWVRCPKDLQDSRGGTALYPNPAEMVRSLGVDWDTSVTRSKSEVAEYAPVSGPGLRICNAGTDLHDLLITMLQEAQGRLYADADEQEAAASRRITADPKYDSVTKTQLIQARVGQGRFRAGVLAREPRCRVTGTSQPGHLVASHIKPWAMCDDSEHLDDANGLMLAPHVDHLFDTGLISFTDDGRLLLAPSLDRAVLADWHLDEGITVGAFARDQSRYLAYHRVYVLGQPRPRRRRNLVGDPPIDTVAVDHLTGHLIDALELD
jgi:hypothetical protein